MYMTKVRCFTIRLRRSLLLCALVVMVSLLGPASVPAALPTVAIQSGYTGVAENGFFYGYFTVSRTGPTTNSLTVEYSIRGTTKNGVDYARLPGVVTIPAGGSSATIVVPPADDDVWEGTETLTLALESNLRPFTIALLPDTQYYTGELYGGKMLMYSRQIEWIVDKKDELNIAFVLHEGDCTDGNTLPEWQRFKNATSLLDGVVPYALAVGNHDGLGTPASQTELFNQFFPLADYTPRPSFGGVCESNRLDNCFHYFTAGGVDWLVLSLEFGPRDEVLAWANQVVTNHPDRRVIVVTHTHIYEDSTLHGSLPTHNHTPTSYGRVNNGTDVWEKFLRHHANVSFVFNGHVLGTGVGRLVGIGDHGNKVYQMLANYQSYANGGSGYLRTVEFNPLADKFTVKSYSPYLKRSLTAPPQQFEYDNLGLFDTNKLAYLIDTNRATATITIADNDRDARPPTIASVRANGFPYEVIVTYGGPVDRLTAESRFNYQIADETGDPIRVIGGTLSADSRTVVLLTASALSVGSAYTLSVVNVRNQEATNGFMAINAQAAFSYSSDLLAANFDDESLAGWQAVDEGAIYTPSNWRSLNGRVEQLSNIYGPDATSLINRRGTYLLWNHPRARHWSSYDVFLQMQSTDDDGIGVMFRYRDANNYYKLEMDRQRNFRQLVKRVGGVDTVLASEPVGYPLYRDVNVTVTVSNNQITVTADYQTLFGGSVTDASHAAGSVALYSWGSEGVSFDNLLVTPINKPPIAAIIEPLAGARFTAPANLVISAIAQDADGGISQVEFYDGAHRLGLLSTSPYSFMWSNATAGSHSLYVKVIDDLGAVGTSAPVSILLTNGDGSPFITAHPASLDVVAGASVVFNVAATGSAPLRYQWRVGGQNIPGATNATLHLPSVQPTNANAYVATVSNSVGVATTLPASLTVLPLRFVTLAMTPDGQFLIELLAEPNRSYLLEATTNLIDWLPVVTLSNPTGALRFLEFNARDHPHRFYRVQPAPAPAPAP